MSEAKLLIDLYEYKSWSEARMFDYLVAAGTEHAPEALQKGMYYLAHINIVDKIFISRLSGTAIEFTSFVTDEEQNMRTLQNEFNNTNAWLLEYVKSLPKEQLQDMIYFTFFDGDKGEMTKERILTHLITHGLLHKGQIGNILPREMLAGWKSNYTSYLNR